MDIFPTAKFQESLTKVTVSIHCSYLRNQLLNAVNQVFPTMIACKLFMSDIDSILNNEMLDRMELNQDVIILKPKDFRYKDAIDLLGIKYKSGKICILHQKSQRLEIVLICMILKTEDSDQEIIMSFNKFLSRALQNFDNIVKKSSDFKLKCLEMENVLTKSISFTDKNYSMRILQMISEINDDDPSVIFYHVLMLNLTTIKGEIGTIGIYNTESEELQLHVIGDKIIDTHQIISINSSNFLYDFLRSNSSVVFKTTDVGDDLKYFLKRIFRNYERPVNTVILSVATISMTKFIKVVLIIVNKVAKDTNFSKVELEFVTTSLLYCTPIIHMANNLQVERLEGIRTRKLLMIAKNLFSKMDNFDELITYIMKEAQSLTHAEGGALFLVDEDRNELVSKVLNGKNRAITRKSDILKDVRFPIETGIAGHVAVSGKLLNVANVYEHPAFDRSIDELQGFKTRSILCFPIQNDRGRVVGVAELCNKAHFPYFNNYDEEIAKAFSVFCHISIINSLIYKKIEDAQQRSVLANKVMTSHNRAQTKISNNLIEKIIHCKIVPIEEILESGTMLTALPKNVLPRDTLMFCLSMFERMNLINRWRIQRRTLANFILSVKRGYRDVPYHNWYHAISVAHFIFAAYMTFDLTKNLYDIENFVLLVSGLCHDIDHRGTNNSFQTKSKSVLATLYSSEGSMLEQHHFAQTVCIIQTEFCNIFETMDNKEYLQALDLLRYVILATDLLQHFRKKPELDKLATKQYNIESLKDRSHLMCILITSADLSDQAKEWSSAWLSSKSINEEFLKQGDMEKELGNTPLESMDRNKACIPLLQIAFIEGVIFPLYTLLVSIFPTAEPLLINTKNNHKNWQKLNDLVNKGIITGLNNSIFDDIEKKNLI